jgi:hypothetical protein
MRVPVTKSDPLMFLEYMNHFFSIRQYLVLNTCILPMFYYLDLSIIIEEDKYCIQYMKE